MRVSFIGTNKHYQIYYNEKSKGYRKFNCHCDNHFDLKGVSESNRTNDVNIENC
jgi:hypothetical protein